MDPLPTCREVMIEQAKKKKHSLNRYTPQRAVYSACRLLLSYMERRRATNASEDSPVHELRLQKFYHAIHKAREYRSQDPSIWRNYM